LVSQGIHPRVFVADRGSHFEGALNDELAKLNITRHRHVAYTPSANGTAERANRELLDGLRTKLLMHVRPELGWVRVLDEVVHDINTAVRERLRGRSPHDVLHASLGATDDSSRAESAALDANLTAIKGAQRAAQHARSARGTTPPEFALGQLVLVSTMEGRPRGTTKLGPRWQGPATVERQTNPYVFDVRFVGSDKRETVHARRLKPFPGAWSVHDPVLVRLADVTVRQRYVVDRIVDLTQSHNRVPRMRVRWLGYGPEDDTWEPVTKLYEDVPTLVSEFLQRGAGLDPRQRKVVPRAWGAINKSEDRRDTRRATAPDAREGGGGSADVGPQRPNPSQEDASYAARRAELVRTMPRVGARGQGRGPGAHVPAPVPAPAPVPVPVPTTADPDDPRRRSGRARRPTRMDDFTT
jgi:hypothetical protein